MKNIMVIRFDIPQDWSVNYLNQTAFELAGKGLRKVKMFSWEKYTNSKLEVYIQFYEEFY